MRRQHQQRTYRLSHPKIRKRHVELSFQRFAVTLLLGYSFPSRAINENAKRFDEDETGFNLGMSSPVPFLDIPVSHRSLRVETLTYNRSLAGNSLVRRFEDRTYDKKVMLLELALPKTGLDNPAKS